MRTQSICLALAIVLLCPFASAQWIHINLPAESAVACFGVIGTNLFAGGGEVFLSADSGTSWTRVDSVFTGPYSVYSLAVSGTNLFVGVDDGVFVSTDSGASWTAVDTSLKNYHVSALAVSGTNLFAGTDKGVVLSTNNGTNWKAVNTGLTNTNVAAVAVSGANLFAGTNAGIFLSTNGGTSWTAVYTGAWVFGLAVSGTTLFAGHIGHGVVVSTDSGKSWTAVNTGLTVIDVYTLHVFGRYLFAAGSYSGIWRRPLSEMITSVQLPSSQVPVAFELHQNYPNPFNPSTTIAYSIPGSREGGVGSMEMKLAVFDLLGREVAVLVNEKKTPGSYEVKFDGSNLASGVYFYRLQAGYFTQTKRLLLLK
jgi:hypothetical protein